MTIRSRNFLKPCKCGCNTQIWNTDNEGRIHDYKQGHIFKVKRFTETNNYNWKGGRTMASQGYVLIKAKGNPRARKSGTPYMYEHDYLMERHLGRQLMKKEIVHHKNGIKTDNRLENLEVICNNGEHMKSKHPPHNSHQHLQELRKAQEMKHRRAEIYGVNG